MAEFFRKKNGDFKRKDKISGGNLFEVQTKLDVQDSIDQASAETIRSVNNRNSPLYGNKIKNTLYRKLDQYKINDFFLLQYHANYFANTIKYRTFDYRLENILPLVIRTAFINGVSGIYYDRFNNCLIPLFIGEIKRDYKGNIIKVSYVSAWSIEWNSDWFNNDKAYQVIEGMECNNVAIFKWGTLGISAWVAFYNFVKFQNSLLRMINSSSFFIAKKGIYKVEDMTVLENEMEDFFDPDTTFFKVNSSVNLSNKFEVFEHKSGPASDLVEYYRMVIASYYSIFGRRVNQDFKNERNLVGEIQTSTSNFDILEREWLFQFYIFTKKLNSMGLQIESHYNPNNDFKPLETPDKVEINNEQRVKNNFIENKKVDGEQ